MRSVSRLSVFLVLATAVSIAAIGTASAKTSKSAFDFHAGDGFPALAPGPHVARAPNGDTVALQATGTFDAGARTASGSGTFEHRDANGTLLATGDLTVTGFTTFVFHGCGVAEGETIPPEFCGGRLLMPVHIVGHPASNPSAAAEFDGTLQINCLVGPKPPNGQPEGIRLDIPGVIHFNKSVSGENIYVQK